MTCESHFPPLPSLPNPPSNLTPNPLPPRIPFSPFLTLQSSFTAPLATNTQKNVPSASVMYPPYHQLCVMYPVLCASSLQLGVSDDVSSLPCASLLRLNARMMRPHGVGGKKGRYKGYCFPG